MAQWTRTVDTLQAESQLSPPLNGDDNNHSSQLFITTAESHFATKAREAHASSGVYSLETSASGSVVKNQIDSNQVAGWGAGAYISGCDSSRAANEFVALS